MRIGWFSYDNSFDDLIKSLSLSKHQIYYLNKSKKTFYGINNSYEVNSLQELIDFNPDVIFTHFKSSTQAYSEFYDNGIFHHVAKLNKKITIIDLSSISVSLTKKVALNNVIDFLSAPIIKYTNNFNQTNYIMPISGKKYIFDNMCNLLADFEIEYFYCGGLASAQVINTANAILNASVSLGLFEAINYANTHNLNLDTLYNAVNTGAGSSNLLCQFLPEISRNNFDHLNKNLVNNANLISDVLHDNLDNGNEFLLSKVVFGILKKLNSKFRNLYGEHFKKFYNINFLSNNNDNHLSENLVNDFFTNNIFDQEYIVDKDYKIFNSFENKESINIEIKKNNFISEIEEKKDNKIIKKEEKIFDVLKNDNQNNLDDIQFKITESENSLLNLNDFNFNQNNLEVNTSNLGAKNNSDYQTPNSLNKTIINDEIKKVFEDKVDAEKGSLAYQGDIIETFIKENNTSNKVEQTLNYNHNNLIEDMIAKQLSTKPTNVNSEDYNQIIEQNEINDFFNMDLVSMPIVSKVLIFDLDGTLLNKEKKVNPENIKTLKKVYESGHEIVIATGRSYEQIIDTINQLGIVRYAIMNNGALIYDIENNFIIRNAKPLIKELINYFLEIVFTKKIPFLLYSDLSVFVYTFKEEEIPLFSDYVSDKTINLSGMAIEDVIEYLEINNIDIFNLCAFTKELNESDWVELFKYYKEDLQECNLTSAIKNSIDIYSGSISKYKGYLKLQEILNFKDNDVYFFGDSNNDYDLMSHIPNGIAMGNANDRLKGVAKYIIGDNNSSAISNFIQKKILI